YLRPTRRRRTKKIEIVNVDWSMPAHPRFHLWNQQWKLMPLAIDEVHFVDRGRIVGDGAAAQPSEIKVGIKNFAAVLSVGNRFKPDFLLKRDDLANCCILDPTQIL